MPHQSPSHDDNNPSRNFHDLHNAGHLATADQTSFSQRTRAPTVNIWHHSSLSHMVRISHNCNQWWWHQTKVDVPCPWRNIDFMRFLCTFSPSYHNLMKSYDSMMEWRPVGISWGLYLSRVWNLTILHWGMAGFQTIPSRYIHEWDCRDSNLFQPIRRTWLL